MKIKEGFIARKVGKEYVVISVGKDNDFNGLLHLNETAKFIWDELVEGNSADDTAKKMSEVYEVDFETALKDVNAFIGELKKENVLDD